MQGGPRWDAEPPPSPRPGPQPMSLGAILDVAFRILRRHWALLLGLALLFAGPGALLTSATSSRFNDVALEVFPGISQGIIEEGAGVTEDELSRLTGALGAYFLATVVAGVLASIGALGFSAVVVADYHARRIELADAVRASLRRAPSALAFILATTVVIFLIVAGGTLLALTALTLFPSSGGGGPGAFLALVAAVAVVGAVVYLTLRWAPAFPVIINEDVGWREALSRSWHLSADGVLRILVVIALGAIITALLAGLLAQLAGLLLVGVLAATVGLDELVAQTVSLAVGAMLVAPLTPVLTAVLYFDLRARRDLPGPEPEAPRPLPGP